MLRDSLKTLKKGARSDGFSLFQYKNYTIEKEGGEYFFAPFKSTPLIAAIFIILSIIIAGGCFYAFAHTGKTE